VSTEKIEISKEYRERYMKIIRSFRIIDDTFMQKVFEDKICVRLLLRIIMNKPDLEVLESKVQFQMKNLQGRSLRLDVYAVDGNGQHYNVEVQRRDSGAGAKRARYHSALLDSNILDVGEDFNNLPETYVIFITENDVLNGNKSIYHIERTIKELNTDFDDKAHIVYVNAQIQDETELGKLMHDFMCSNPNEMNYKELAERASYFKFEQTGGNGMCELMEEFKREIEKEATEKGIEKGKREGMKEGVASTRINTAIKMLKSGRFTNKEVSDFSDLSEEKVAELAVGIL
jgi:predicted transposase/invertase (TIGR01784 family)